MPEDKLVHKSSSISTNNLVKRGLAEFIHAPTPEITLNSGRLITLDQMFQYRTYRGLLEGTPTKEMNDEYITNALMYSKEKLWRVGFGGDPYLIKPAMAERTTYPSPGLPGTICLASFDSRQAAKDPEADSSHLVIVWFQEEFVFPIDPSILQIIKSLDWEKYAWDGYI